MSHSTDRLKRLAVQGMTAGPLQRLFWPLLRRRATIFMLHRFRMPDLGVEGQDPANLEAALAELRRRRYSLIDLRTMFTTLVEGRDFRVPAIAFTLDDGYLDQAAVAAPAFARYDCPVTTFVTTGFLDGELWFWWDRIEYLFRRTTRQACRVTLAGQVLDWAWQSTAERRRAQMDFTTRCKRVPDAEKHAAIDRLAGELGIALPSVPPPEYAPMSWDQLRACESRGMSFGPHTVTHPILSQTPDDQAAREIGGSWQRLSSETASAVPVFCYPNGQSPDFGPREVALLRAQGLLGAVVGEPGYADVAGFHRDPEQPFRVRRFSYPDEQPLVLQVVSGVERAKQIIRRET